MYTSTGRHLWKSAGPSTIRIKGWLVGAADAAGSIFSPIKFKMMEWQNVVYCAQSSRLSSQEGSHSLIGEECIHDKRKGKKLLDRRTGLDRMEPMCIHRLALQGRASQLSLVLSLDPSSGHLNISSSTHKKKEKLGIGDPTKRLLLFHLPSTILPIFSYIFTYHNVNPLLNLIDVLGLLRRWPLPAFFFQ